MAEIKFLADEHIDLPVVKALRERGIDIISVLEILRGRPDDKILEFANNDNRCVITRDKDYTRLSKITNHKGIAFLTKQLDIGDLIKEIKKIAIEYKPEDLENAVIYIPQK